MKKKLMGVIALVVVVGVAGFALINRNKAVSVNIAEVVEGNIEKYVEELGVVKATNQSSIYSFVSGRAIEVLVEIGDHVKEGDVLVRIDSQQQERQLIEMEAQRTAIEAQYNEATKPVDANEIKKMELIIADMERRLTEAEINLTKSEGLYKSGAISNQEYQNIISVLESDRTNLTKSRLELDQMKKPLSQNIVLQYEAQLKQIDTQLEALKSQSTEFTITAPIDGIVMMKTIDEGHFLQPGVHIMEVGDIGELYIESDVLVGDIANVKEGATVRLSNKSLNLDNLKGTVSKIHPQAFSKISDLGIEQKRIKVEITLDGEVSNIRPGYDLDIKIIVDKNDNALLIPENAIFQQNGKSFVFVNENGQARRREVQKGIENQKLVEIKSGLNKGEMVITSPDDELEEGIIVKIQ